MMKIRVGEIHETCSCGKCEIIEYENNRNVTVMFLDDRTVVRGVSYYALRNGIVANPNFPIICGKGFVGVGKYNTNNNNKYYRSIYGIWIAMMHRCYDPVQQEKQPTYVGCSVAKEWWNFQNFAAWYEANDIPGERVALDKDILVKGNKVYSPETCCIVPQQINNLLVKQTAHRDLPTGVKTITNSTKYQVLIKKYGKVIYLGLFEDAEEASKVYKKAKVEYIREVALKYKNVLSERVFNVLYNYEL